MASNVTKIKARLNVVNGAYKVTSAMKLISTIKLKSTRSKMLSQRHFSNELDETCNQVFTYLENVNHPLMSVNEKANKNLYIVVSSSLGLCGAYNSNIFKLADASIKKEDEAIILGNKGLIHFANSEFTSIEGYEEYASSKDKKFINKIIEYVMSTYQKGDYKEIHMIYTTYKNPLTFIAKDVTLLPFSFTPVKGNVGIPPLLEPNKEELVNFLIPFYLNNKLYSCLVESEVCEYASRNNAMENATNNAEELMEELQLEFNKARQSAITQEIVEIVGASKGV